AKEGEQLSRQAGRFAHARQFKRMRRVIKRQRTIVGRLAREIDRKASAIGQAVREALDEVLGKAQRIGAQSARCNFRASYSSSGVERNWCSKKEGVAEPDNVTAGPVGPSCTALTSTDRTACRSRITPMDLAALGQCV